MKSIYKLAIFISDSGKISSRHTVKLTCVQNMSEEIINKLLEDYVVSSAMNISIRYNNGNFPYILILLSYEPNISKWIC